MHERLSVFRQYNKLQNRHLYREGDRMLTNHTRISDLAAENFGFAAPVDTDPAQSYLKNGFMVRRQKTRCGTYHTILTGEADGWTTEKRRGLIATTAALLHDTAQNRSPRQILVCGIGNPSLCADALGPVICSRLPAVLFGDDTDLPRVHVIVPGVPAQTGIRTKDLVCAAAQLCHADLLIAADALCAKSRERLGSVIQISGDAITPGSGTVEDTDIENELSSRTMPCPVCTIGVPTVIRASVFCENVPQTDDLLVTSGSIDHIVNRFAEVLAASIVRFVMDIRAGDVK